MDCCMNIVKSKFSLHPFIVLSTLYIISNILIFFVHGIFWDDWTLYHDAKAIEQQFFYGNGAIILGHLHIFLQQLSCDTILLYHSLIFFIGWLCVLLFYKTLISCFNLDNISSLFIGSLYAAFPLGYAHMTMICLPYQIGLLLQLVSIQSFVLNRTKFNLLLYILFFILQFGASLFLVSNVVFWGGLLFYFVLQKTWAKRNLSILYGIDVFKQLMKWLIYYVPCIIFWIIRSLYFLPTGVYKEVGYNSFSLKAFVALPVNLVKSIINCSVFVTSQVSVLANSPLFLIICFMLLVVIYIMLNKYTNVFANIKVTNSHFAAILFLYIFAIGAYLMVGLIPVFDSMNDRHGILIILAICPLVYFLLNVLLVNKAKFLSLVFVISIMSTYSISQYWEAIYQSQRNDAILFFFRDIKLPEGNIFVYEDDNNNKIGHCFYSWSGMYYNATNRQDRCIVMSNNRIIYDSKAFLKEAYHQKDAYVGKPTIFIEFPNKNETRKIFSVLKRFFYFYFNPSKYKDIVVNEFNILFKEVDGIEHIYSYKKL